MQRGRLSQRGFALGLLVVAIAIASPWLSSRDVRGSIPTSDARLAALLEAQGEHARARAQLGADSSATGQAALAPMRLRLANRTGDVRAALAELDAHPGAFDSREAALVRAALELRAGVPESALVALGRGPAPDGLEAWAALVEAEAASELGRWDVAQAAAERTPVVALPTAMRQRLAVVRGLAALHRNDTAAIAKLGPELGEAARRDDRTGFLLFDLARAAQRSGDTARARSWLLDLLAARPAPAESAYAELLRTAGDDFLAAPDNVLEIARYEARSGRHAPARTRLGAAVRRADNASMRAELQLQVADSQIRTADYKDCLATLSRAARDAQGTRLEPERLRLRARAERRSGAATAAMASYAELARRFPAHAIADDALSEIGWLHEGRRELTDAEHAYMRAARAYPNGTLADDCALRAGLCALRDGRPASAIAHFEELVTRHPRSPLVDNALYWQIVASLQRGETERVDVLRARLGRDFPRSYFTYLARRGVDADLSESATPQAESPAANEGGLDRGLVRAARVQAATDSAIAELRRSGLRAPRNFAAETRLWRFLLDHGFAPEAHWEARRLESVYDGDSGALVEMIALAATRGAHERLVRWAYVLTLRTSDPALAGALEVLLYPAPFAPALAEVTAQLGLSHAVVVGLMRQESAFDPAVDSGAGARGLMQIMPEVGRRLWPAGERQPYHADVLYQPDTNIALGCKLLAAEIQRARGDVPQALAAYNAGGDAAESWARRLGPQDPPEMYVDLVEYSETRNYLKTVLGNIENYRRLYALP